jgi:hypothetical protein
MCEETAAATAAEAVAADCVGGCRGCGVVGSCGDCDDTAIAARPAKVAGARFTCGRYEGLLGLFFCRQSIHAATSGSDLSPFASSWV